MGLRPTKSDEDATGRSRRINDLERVFNGAARTAARSLTYFYCVRNYRRKKQPHEGQHGSCCTRNRAIWIRSVAIECWLCR